MDGALQTVARQSPSAGRRSTDVTVWLNPSCQTTAAHGPGIREPTLKSGSTELISGFYVVGGPLRLFSAPQCKLPEPLPGAGTVEVIDARGTVIATQTSIRGRFVKIPLPAGSYTIRGTFLNATVNGNHPMSSETLVIPVGQTVRQDFFLDVP